VKMGSCVFDLAANRLYDANGNETPLTHGIRSAEDFRPAPRPRAQPAAAPEPDPQSKRSSVRPQHRPPDHAPPPKN
jgi:hypothetical protein